MARKGFAPDSSKGLIQRLFGRLSRFGRTPETANPGIRGRAAEAEAARFLETRGLVVLERNFRVRGGEIDLICREAETLVFVEVRHRSRNDFGGAGASIGAAKRRRLIFAAQCYLQSRPACDCRFDCLLFEGKKLEWIRDAFAAG